METILKKREVHCLLTAPKALSLMVAGNAVDALFDKKMFLNIQDGDVGFT